MFGIVMLVSLQRGEMLVESIKNCAMFSQTRFSVKVVLSGKLT